MESMAVKAVTSWESVVRLLEDAVRTGAEASDLDYFPGGMLGGEISWSWPLSDDGPNREISVLAAIADDGLQVSVQAAKSPDVEEGSLQRRVFWTDFVELNETDAANLEVGITAAMRKAKDWLAA